MQRRNSPQRTIDGLTFPLRVKLRVPYEGRIGYGNSMLTWLRDRIGEGNFALHRVETLAGDGTAVYFRQVADLLAFLEAFPKLQLADETELRAGASLLSSRRRAG